MLCHFPFSFASTGSNNSKFAHHNVRMCQAKNLLHPYRPPPPLTSFYDGNCWWCFKLPGFGSTKLNVQCTACIYAHKMQEFPIIFTFCHASCIECTNICKIIHARCCCWRLLFSVQPLNSQWIVAICQQYWQ